MAWPGIAASESATMGIPFGWFVDVVERSMKLLLNWMNTTT